MTITGAAAYGLALLPSAFFNPNPFYLMIVSLAVASGLTAGIAGIVQRTYLRPYWEFSSTWAWASGLGWGFGVPLAVVLSAVLREPLSGMSDATRLMVFLIAAAGAGMLSSLGQWIALRQVTHRNLWWLFANGVGWLMAWILVLAVGLFIGGGEPLPTTLDRAGDALILGGLAGFVIGFEQGIAIVGLFAQSAWEKMRPKLN